MTGTLVPLHKLLGDLADRLDHAARTEEVSGEAWVTVTDAVDVLRALAQLGVDDVHAPAPGLEDELPDYCARHDCQNLAAVGWGPQNVRLCLSCYDDELARVGETVTLLRRLS